MPTGFPTYVSGDILTETDLNDISNAIVSLENGKRWFSVSAGSGNAYEMNITEQFSDYSDGQLFLMHANRDSDNSSGCSLDVNGKGGKDIYGNDGAQLVESNIKSGGFYLIAYRSSGDRFICLNPSPIPVTYENGVTPNGDVDGVNDTFTLPANPTAGTLLLFVDGLYQAPGGEDYTLTGNSIEFVTPPTSGAKIKASFRH